MDRPIKRLKKELDRSISDVGPDLPSLTKSITPPPLRAQRSASSRSIIGQINQIDDSGPAVIAPASIPSPFQLTHIQDQASSQSGNNVDTIRLGDILGDPLIRECWQFNYMIDVDFLMRQFDEDVRELVQVKVVHGSWKREDRNRMAIEEGCSRYANVEPIIAYMPEPLGTHHSKMMVLLRHDNLAQIVIHTANMIPFDWGNMCQALWRSPLLPLRESVAPETGDTGSGARFKRDLLAYLNAYGSKKTGSLVCQLSRYDFASVRAALVASVPSRQRVSQTDSRRAPSWGWQGLRDTLRHVPVDEKCEPHIVVQVSSIASLGQTPKWLHDVLFDSLSSSPVSGARPKYSILFPTPDEIRRSINGYLSGSSIHMKLQSASHQKQLQYMKPYLCRWAGDGADSVSSASKRDAGRRRMAPHIKTYIRFSDANNMDAIDWAMVTSANLSTQAWGAATNANGEVRICSWEIGVIVWPSLLQATKMVPCFKRDFPTSSENLDKDTTALATLVGLRMPYDLPLTPYSRDDMPWCAGIEHREPDWRGQTWR